MKKNVRIGLVVAAVVFVFDQASKWFFIDIMRLPEGEIPLLPFFKLVMVWNQGISFGMLASEDELRRWLLIGMTLAITAALFVWLWREKKTLVCLGLGLVIGGALGNIIDRYRWGAVADFFYFHYGKLYWPAFNIADAAIFIGVVLLCWESIVNPSQDNQAEKEDGRR